MDIKKEVGKRIRMLREMKHLTRETLCDDESEITVRQLARIESGQSSPSLSKVEYIAHNLGCPISHIVDMDHMILPSEYLILKDKLIKFQTYGDDDRIKLKEELFDRVYEHYYDSLPEDEQIAVGALQASFDVFVSEDAGFGDALLDEYFEQVKIKKNYSVNDLLLIKLYFTTCVARPNVYDREVFWNLSHKVLRVTNTSSLDTNYMLKQVIISSLTIQWMEKSYSTFEPYVKAMNRLMILSQDFQKKPIVDMLEAMCTLFHKRDKEKAIRLYDRAIICAQAFGDQVLEARISGEKERDLKTFEEMKS
ncbi:helix-turn-helix domain-containing protein [Streptococcus mitis]|uniref:helix-turn-helix domain-containing protein n=1 Tax=Streptococcus mitis TaxID=28037 RepID=UPI0039C10B20